MEQYAGIDVSLESASVCVVDAAGRIVREAKLTCEPEVLIAWFGKLEVTMARIGLEAGPLSQWLYARMREAGLSVELLETRHVRDAPPPEPLPPPSPAEDTPAPGGAPVSTSDPPDHPDKPPEPIVAECWPPGVVVDRTDRGGCLWLPLAV